MKFPRVKGDLPQRAIERWVRAQRNPIARVVRAIRPNRVPSGKTYSRRRPSPGEDQ
jgi:hypothetical protein